MTLVNTRELMNRATATGTGQGAFNVIHVETAEGLVGGAEAAGVPLILQISENCAKYHGGMTKINVSTHLNGFFTRAGREYLDANPAVVDSRKYIKAGRDALVLESARMLTLFAKAK